MHDGLGKRSFHSQNTHRKSHKQAGVKAPKSSSRMQYQHESGMCAHEYIVFKSPVLQKS